MFHSDTLFFRKKKVTQLRELLSDAGLATDGKKADLVARLAEHYGSNPPEEEEEADTRCVGAYVVRCSLRCWVVRVCVKIFVALL